MKLIVFPLILIGISTNALGQYTTKEEALREVNETLKGSEEAAGLHSLDLFSLKVLGGKDKIIANDSGIYYEQVNPNNDKKGDEKFEYDEMKKIVVLTKEKAQYGAHWIGDYHLLLHSRKAGKLLIVGVTKDRLDSFIEALQFLCPNIKKVNHAY